MISEGIKFLASRAKDEESPKTRKYKAMGRKAVIEDINQGEVTEETVQYMLDAVKDITLSAIKRHDERVKLRGNIIIGVAITAVVIAIAAVVIAIAGVL